MMKLRRLIVLLFFSLLLLPTYALALHIDDVQWSIDAEFGTTNNDNPIPDQVNSDTMFDFDDWVFLEKEQDSGQEPNPGGVGLVVTFNGTPWESDGGTWSLNSNIWDFYTDIMMVMKDGNDTLYAGYLLDGIHTNGTWSTKTTWFDDKSKDLSHMSVYGRVGETPVPEPSTMILFGIGLLGLTGVSRRKI